MHTEMNYADEIDPNWNPVVGTANFKSDTGKYDYSLEIDAAGRIVGGEWLGLGSRPAFLVFAPKLEFHRLLLRDQPDLQVRRALSDGLLEHGIDDGPKVASSSFKPYSDEGAVSPTARP